MFISDVWRIGTKLMPSKQKKKIQSEVCGCVTQKVPQSTATAILNSNSYNSMVVNAVTQTINLCVVEALK